MDIIESVGDDGTDKSKVMLLKYNGRKAPKKITFERADALVDAVGMIKSCLKDYLAAAPTARPRTKSVLPVAGGVDDDEEEEEGDEEEDSPFEEVDADGDAPDADYDATADEDAPEAPESSSMDGALLVGGMASSAFVAASAVPKGPKATTVAAAPKPNVAAPNMKGEMMYSGCICCYQACNPADIMICCEGGGTCLCMEEKCCLAAEKPQFPIGMIAEPAYIVKVGLPCCTLGLKNPDPADLINMESKCLCFRSVGQFPFGDKGARTRRRSICTRGSIRCTPSALSHLVATVLFSPSH